MKINEQDVVAKVIASAGGMTTKQKVVLGVAAVAVTVGLLTGTAWLLGLLPAAAPVLK